MRVQHWILVILGIVGAAWLLRNPGVVTSLSSLWQRGFAGLRGQDGGAQ